MIKPENSTVTQHFRVEILTPVHIGGSSENHWQKGIDFITRDGRLWILDIGRISRDKTISVDALTRTLFEGKPVDELLKGKNLEPLSIKSFDFSADGNNDIKRHVFNGYDGKPYIPGSSLKGATSSILIKHFLQQNNISRDSAIVKNTLGDFENSFMRFFQFTDIHFTDTFLTSTKIFNLQKGNWQEWEGGWKHSRNETSSAFKQGGFTTLYESLKIGSHGSLTISYKKQSVEQLYLNARQNKQVKIPPAHTAGLLTSFSFPTFCKLVNDHTRNFLKKEIAFFEKYKIDTNTDRLLEGLRELERKIKELASEKECILRLGSGSGFHSITGDWQYQDFIHTGERNGKRKYKSRKLAIGKDSRGEWKFAPMGFVKLTILSQDDFDKANEARTAMELTIRREAEEMAIVKLAEMEAARIAAEEAKKPKMYDGPISKNLEVDAQVVMSGKPNKVKIFVNGYEQRQFEMVDSAQQPLGYLCRVYLVVEKGKLLRVRHGSPK